MTTVTVATGKRLTMDVSGFIFVYQAGETVAVPTFEVQYLRRDGIIV